MLDTRFTRGENPIEISLDGGEIGRWCVGVFGDDGFEEDGDVAGAGRT